MKLSTTDIGDKLKRDTVQLIRTYTIIEDREEAADLCESKRSYVDEILQGRRSITEGNITMMNMLIEIAQKRKAIKLC
jgi:hypothetical protein